MAATSLPSPPARDCLSGLGFFLVLYNASLDQNENDLMESDII